MVDLCRSASFPIPNLTSIERRWDGLRLKPDETRMWYVSGL